MSQDWLFEYMRMFNKNRTTYRVVLIVDFSPLQILSVSPEVQAYSFRPINIKRYNYTWPVLYPMAFSEPWLLTASAPD